MNTFAQATTRITARHHCEMMIICALPFVLSLFLQVRADGRVAVQGLSPYPLPSACVSQQLGFDCPGCGLTRSFILLMQGDLSGSLHYHRLGWLIALAALAQIPYRLIRIYRPQTSLDNRRLARWFSRTLIALLLGNWLVGFFL